MTGGIAAGAGALISGSMIASSNRNIARAQSSCLEDLNNLGKDAIKLNNTFNDEFNNRQKRLIQMHLSDEDDEPIKFSEYFNQVPVFKEDLRTAFYSETKKSIISL